MAELNKSYRIKTKISEDGTNLETPVVNVHLDQTYDLLEILSLKLSTADAYKSYEGSYGVIVGRVVANGNFGVPNAKISIFIPVDETDTIKQKINYGFATPQDTDKNYVRYNTLPDYTDNPCHQNVGTFPNKRLVLDNDDVIETFEKYWKYTTTSNEAGDYMLFGVPTGSQQIHVDLDLSDCGMLSQRPRDLTYKGYNANLFDSPNKFKKSDNLNSLAQIYSQDRGLYVYPYWGEQTQNGDNLAITRCDIQLEYKFEPTCVFMGSIVTDKGSNAIGKNCTGTENVGKMPDLIAGEGSIEMIRKTLDGKVEQFQIKGDRLIDGDGVWCYQIPMNLDYVMTDEFGNIVPTDNPEKGIPTRTRVRFRIALDDQPNDATARKRCRFLVPNNPKLDKTDYPSFYESHEADYEFGTATKEESYCDMFWNKVYTVKSYIPRLQKNNNTTNRKHTGIKLVNHSGDNNPMPYNALNIKLNFMFRLICVLTKVIVYIIVFINTIIGTILIPLCAICKILRGIGKIPFIGGIFKALSKPFCAMIFSCIKLSSDFCDDGINKITYYPGCMGCQWDETLRKHNKEQAGITNPEELTEAKNEPSLTNWSQSTLFTCIENSLAQDNDATSFLFQNDWINGVLYAPLWFRKITPKKSFLFGLFKRKAKDQWCNADKPFNLIQYQGCALKRSNDGSVVSHLDGKTYAYKRVTTESQCGDKCHEKAKFNLKFNTGLVLTRQTLIGQTVYYYKAVEYDSSENVVKEEGEGGAVKLLFATDIVLLGSLNDCDLNGVPQFFKNLEPSTYRLPSDILFTDTVIQVNDLGEGVYDVTSSTLTESTGCDWGNLNTFDECGKMGKSKDGGLFYGIGCSAIEMSDKSCINLSRICEFGVSIDDSKFITNLSKLSGGDMEDTDDNVLRPDGFISYDELYNTNERSMFATLNGNNLRTKLNNTNGLREYDFHYLYVDNFDGSLKNIMTKELGGCTKTYGQNAAFESNSNDYYMFRMGGKPYFYDKDGRMPRYDNSFYFYFGLKNGKTAIEKFNSQFFALCYSEDNANFQASVQASPNDWCSEISTNDSDRNGYVTFNFTGISTPYDIIINSVDNMAYGYEFKNIVEEKIYIGNYNEELENNTNNYTNIAKYNNDDYVTFLNGEYEITVTDSEGNITSTTFSMNAKYLSFNYEQKNFVTPNNQRFAVCNSYNKVITDYSMPSINRYISAIASDPESNPKEGGFIILKDLYNNGESFDCVITVEPYNVKKDMTDYGKDYWYGVSFKAFVDSSGAVTLKTSPTGVKLDNNVIYVAVPKGDIAYKITVTQLCDGMEVRNSVSSSITVTDPIPYKLFINGVDVDVFKPSEFNTGWSINTLNNFGTPAITSVKGWTNLGNVNNYDWEKLTDYVKLETNEEKKAFKQEYIKKIKEAFQITCASGSKDIVYTVTSSNYPITYKTIYNEEEVNEEVQDLNILSNEGKQTAASVDSISDIMIPTITNFDNENYGYSDSTYPSYWNLGEGKCFGYDNHNNNKERGDNVTKFDKKWFKKPYFIGVYNSENETIPTTLEKGDVDDNKNLMRYFSFHIIDKAFNFKMMAWSYINDIPYYWPSGTVGVEDTDKDGVSVSMNGLVTGYVFNGVLESDGQTYPNVRFAQQYIGNNRTIMINSIDNDEDKIPTRRLIVKDRDTNAPYKEYIVLDGVKDEENSVVTQQYVEVFNKNEDLVLEDANCSIQRTVQGKLKVNLLSDSINDCVDNNKKISLSFANNDSEEGTFYIISVDDPKTYPINKINKIGDNFCYEDTITTGENNKPIFAYDVTSDYLLTKKVDESVKGYKLDDNGEKIEVKGYSEVGNFDKLSEKAYYVIGILANNCRTISPVYEFKKKEVNIKLAKGNVDGDMSYFLEVTIEKPEKSYYIKNYTFSIETTIDIDGVIVQQSVEIPKSQNKVEKPSSTDQSKWNTDTMYAVSTGTAQNPEFTVYSYSSTWVSQENLSEEESSRYSDIAGSKRYITQIDGEEEKPFKIFTKKTEIVDDGSGGTTTVETDIWEISDPAEGEDLSGVTKITSEHFRCVTAQNTHTDEEGNETVENIYTVFDIGWTEINSSEEDPTQPHYEKAAVVTLTKSQYDTLYRSLIFTQSFMKSKTTVIVTDYTGLKHKASIKNITK